SFVWIKRRVTPLEAQQVAALDLPGIAFTPEYLRVYPNLDLASALLGFTGVDTQGLEGSEYAFDSYLKGAEGIKVIDKDALGRTLLYSDEDTPTGGGSVRLTLNPEIQFIAEQALERAVQGTRADVGVAIVMRSRTGELLAVAQAPAFNPNAYGDYDKGLFFDRAITDGYEPGSVFKIVTASVALEEKIVTPQTMIYCEQGQFKNYDSVIHDVEPQGWLNLAGILRVSSNIGAAKVGLLVPASVFHEYLLRFGFGQRVGIFVAPDGRRLAGEADGYVLPADKWTPVDHAAIAFGHGVLVSPLQMITAANTIATGGLLLHPYLVQEIRDARGRVVERDQPKVMRRVISPATAALVRDYMEGVVGDGGTGTRAAVPGYLVAGKTGTTERYDLLARGYSKTRDIASFVGFVPADKPELTVLVLVQDPKVSRYGGQAAAPVFREIVQRSLPLLGVWPDTVKHIPLGQGTAQAN
ncbi:MAG TPA: penicillin-binding protein 2, partial [bacterium]|nr:penicillin-binding protein 2 [bacterium]